MAETNHDGCEQECGCWEEGFADALAGMQEWSITVHDGTCRCEFWVTGIALIEAALGDMAGILREIRGELKPAEPSDELTVPGPAGGDPRLPAVFINSGAGVGHQAGKEPLAGERSRWSNFRGSTGRTSMPECGNGRIRGRRQAGTQVSRTPRSLAGKPLAGFCATRSRRIQDLYGMVVHVIRCNTHYAIDNRR